MELNRHDLQRRCVTTPLLLFQKRTKDSSALVLLQRDQQSTLFCINKLQHQRSTSHNTRSSRQKVSVTKIIATNHHPSWLSNVKLHLNTVLLLVY